jgi:hypothetical protein
MVRKRQLFFVFACSAACVLSAPIETTSQIEGQAPFLPQCEIEGNPDFYGLGIRIGIYLQWITALLANHTLMGAIGTNLETNTIFLVALFVATAVASARNTVQTAELVVLLQLCFGFLFSILSIWGHRTGGFALGGKKARFPLIGSFFRLILATALATYSAWFWFRYHDLHHRPQECRDFTFMFARVDIAGGLRYFLEVQSSAILAVYTFLFVREFIMIVCFFIFVSMQTVLLAGLATWFGAEGSIARREQRETDRNGSKIEDPEQAMSRKRRLNRRRALREIWFLIKQWVALSSAMAWKEMNSKESAGSKRPDIKYYLIPFLDMWIFITRTSVQFFCLFFFKKMPRVDFIPMPLHPVLDMVRRRNQPESRLRRLHSICKDFYTYVSPRFILQRHVPYLKCLYAKHWVSMRIFRSSADESLDLRPPIRLSMAAIASAFCGQ